MPLILEKKDVKKYKDKIDELIELVGLKDRKKHRPAQLSGGEQQRVAIARALINEPKVILADEPTGNLDTKNSEQIVELLQTLSTKKEMTIIMVTHDQNIGKFSDRRIYLKDGQVI